jgi:hypothetical protein
MISRLTWACRKKKIDNRAIAIGNDDSLKSEPDKIRTPRLCM